MTACIYSPKDYILIPQSKLVIPTGLKIKVPYGHFFTKSGLAIRHNIHVGAGIVDPDYTGEIKVLLLNLGNFGWLCYCTTDFGKDFHAYSS